MKVSETTSEPKQLKLENGLIQNVRLVFQTYKIKDDKDTQELIEVFAEGVDILMTFKQKDFYYVIVKKVVPIKVAISGEVGPKPSKK